MNAVYYNELDPFMAAWLRNLALAGFIPAGEIDDRSIDDVDPDDLRGFVHCHFFAGLGGWAYAAELAGWPLERPLWTGSCPCQPFSAAGRGAGEADARHKWPAFFRLIERRRPTVVVGEQVASPDGRAWFTGVRLDLEVISYAVRGAIIPACAVGAPHKRERLFFLADADGERRESERLQPRSWRPEQAEAQALRAGALVDPVRERLAVAEDGAQDMGEEQHAPVKRAGFWGGARALECADGKTRRIKPGLDLLVDGLPAGVAGPLSGFGNAIVPQVAAEVLAAWLEVAP